MGLVRIRRIVPGLTTGLNPAINLVPRTGPGPDIARLRLPDPPDLPARTIGSGEALIPDLLDHAENFFRRSLSHVVLEDAHLAFRSGDASRRIACGIRRSAASAGRSWRRPRLSSSGRPRLPSGS